LDSAIPFCDWERFPAILFSEFRERMENSAAMWFGNRTWVKSPLSYLQNPHFDKNKKTSGPSPFRICTYMVRFKQGQGIQHLRKFFFSR